MDLGRFESRIDFGIDANELFALIQIVDALAERAIGHRFTARRVLFGLTTIPLTGWG